jgi:hypothetical protein
MTRVRHERRIEASVEDRTVTVVLRPAKNAALTTSLGVMGVPLAIMVIGLVGYCARQALLTGLAGAVIGAVMFGVGGGSILGACILLLRWNLKGEMHLKIAPEELKYSRKSYPFGNRETILRNYGGAFCVWRPLQGPGTRIDVDYQAWGVGLWWFGLGGAVDSRPLLTRLTRAEVRCVADAVREAGYTVESRDPAWMTH